MAKPSRILTSSDMDILNFTRFNVARAAATAPGTRRKQLLEYINSMLNDDVCDNDISAIAQSDMPRTIFKIGFTDAGTAEPAAKFLHKMMNAEEPLVLTDVESVQFAAPLLADQAFMEPWRPHALVLLGDMLENPALAAVCCGDPRFLDNIVAVFTRSASRANAAFILKMLIQIPAHAEAALMAGWFTTAAAALTNDADGSACEVAKLLIEAYNAPLRFPSNYVRLTPVIAAAAMERLSMTTLTINESLRRVLLDLLSIFATRRILEWSHDKAATLVDVAFCVNTEHVPAVLRLLQMIPSFKEICPEARYLVPTLVSLMTDAKLEPHIYTLCALFMKLHDVAIGMPPAPLVQKAVDTIQPYNDTIPECKQVWDILTAALAEVAEEEEVVEEVSDSDEDGEEEEAADASGGVAAVIDIEGSEDEEEEAEEEEEEGSDEEVDEVADDGEPESGSESEAEEVAAVANKQNKRGATENGVTQVPKRPRLDVTA